jgi:CheY-like chemotaxis protein
MIEGAMTAARGDSRTAGPRAAWCGSGWSDGAPPRIPLILSCNSNTGTKVECLDLGARDYLTKPFSVAELTAGVCSDRNGAR